MKVRPLEWCDFNAGCATRQRLFEASEPCRGSNAVAVVTNLRVLKKMIRQHGIGVHSSSQSSSMEEQSRLSPPHAR